MIEWEPNKNDANLNIPVAVSYTHLDVYKRQQLFGVKCNAG